MLKAEEEQIRIASSILAELQALDVKVQCSSRAGSQPSLNNQPVAGTGCKVQCSSRAGSQPSPSNQHAAGAGCEGALVFEHQYFCTGGAFGIVAEWPSTLSPIIGSAAQRAWDCCDIKKCDAT
jgi:hypothetical protein